MASRPEVHVFVVWSQARGEETRILDDIRRHFDVLEVLEVEWSPGEIFARNLTRMYGQALPPGSDKERHCGTGPFLLVAVADRHPTHRIRRTGHGPKLLNGTMFDARTRYRRWTGGGHRVHASDSVGEAERNLVLLTGRRPETFLQTGRRPPAARPYRADPVGTGGWDSQEQLLTTLEVYGARAVGRTVVHDVEAREDVEELAVRASDVWWAETIAGGREVDPHVLEVRVGERRVRLRVMADPVVRPRAPAVVVRRILSAVLP